RLIAAFRYRLTENDLFFMVVHRRVELKLRNAVRFADSPSCERSRNRNDILLGVASIDTERMKFEKFPSVVFVQPQRTAHLASVRRGRVFARGLRLPVVQIVEHRRMTSRRKE